MSENRTAVKEWKCAKRIKWCDRVGGMNPFFIIWTLEGLKWFQWADDAARIYVNEGRVNHAEMQRTSIWLFFHIAESRGYKKRVENWKVAVRGGCILFAGMVSQVSDFLFGRDELFISIYKGLIPSRKTGEYYKVFIGVKKMKFILTRIRVYPLKAGLTVEALFGNIFSGFNFSFSPKFPYSLEANVSCIFNTQRRCHTKFRKLSPCLYHALYSIKPIVSLYRNPTKFYDSNKLTLSGQDCKFY